MSFAMWRVCQVDTNSIPYDSVLVLDITFVLQTNSIYNYIYIYNLFEYSQILLRKFDKLILRYSGLFTSDGETKKTVLGHSLC